MGTLIETLTAPNVDGAPSDRTFIPDGPVTLSPLTKYWFVLGSSNGGTFDWFYADTNNMTGPGILDNYNYSPDNGATWVDFGNNFPFFLEVRVDGATSTSVEVDIRPGSNTNPVNLKAKGVLPLCSEMLSVQR